MFDLKKKIILNLHHLYYRLMDLLDLHYHYHQKYLYWLFAHLKFYEIIRIETHFFIIDISSLLLISDKLLVRRP